MWTLFFFMSTLLFVFFCGQIVFFLWTFDFLSEPFCTFIYYYLPEHLQILAIVRSDWIIKMFIKMPMKTKIAITLGLFYIYYLDVILFHKPIITFFN